MIDETKDVEGSAQGRLNERFQRRLRQVRSADLFQGARALIIVHNDEEYRLRITRLGKLILTK